MYTKTIFQLAVDKRIRTLYYLNQVLHYIAAQTAEGRMHMKHFAGITTMEELKKAYKRLAKQFHPDLNKGTDTTAIMAEINAEYERMVEAFQMGGMNANAFDGFREFINQLLNVLNGIEDVTIEICGAWVWVTGNTYPHREALGINGVGMKYASKKKAWHWHEGEHVKKSRKNYDMNEIRVMHGSEIIKKGKPLKTLTV